MKILNLHDKNADFSNTGGKASGLHKLASLGFCVPKGFVLTEFDLSSDLDQAVDFYKSFGVSTVAVRSSASNEDGVEFSSAGQYSTFLNVEGEQSFRQAVIDCVNSLSNTTAESYAANFKQAQSSTMNVVVQQMLDPKSAGVCFTLNPVDKSCLLVEAVRGLGEALVSGEATAQQYSVKRQNPDFHAEGVLNSNELQQIADTALKAEKDFGIALDIEWAIDKNGTLHLLQARPITALDDCDIDELDPKYDMTGMVITRCNIGEMLPGAVTPLTLSTSLYSIDFGMREMLKVAGVLKSVDDLPPFSCALSCGNHLFMNLTTLYRMESFVVGTKSASIEVSICGRELGLQRPKIKKVGFFRRLKNGKNYFSFMLSRNKAKQQLAEIADTLALPQLETAKEMFEAIDSNKSKIDKAMTLHYITSSHSGAMSSAAFMVLQSKITDNEKAYGVLAEMLADIDGIESVDILRSLRTLAKAILKECPNAKNFSAEQLSSFLDNATGDVALAHQNFLTRHGHRTIREAEMRNKGWADDKEAFLSYLKTVIESGAEEAQKVASESVKSIAKRHGFKGFKKSILIYLANQAREGVVNREFSKSKFVKVADIFKKAYTNLANLMVNEGLLPDSDLIYFLTHEEIGELVNNQKISLVKKAIKRRRLLPEQAALTFNEVSEGKPQPVTIETTATDSGKQLVGTPLSRGIVTAKARVVKCIDDARQLQKGEIMVASYTDIGWSPYYCLVSALVTEVGSALSHGAVVAREYSLPLVSNVLNATKLIKTGDTLTVNGNLGTVTVVLQ